MDTQTEQNLKSKSTWGRLLYIILYAICFNVAEIVLAAIAIVQFFSSLFTGKPLKQLQSFGTALSDYLRQVADFLTYASDEKPFPIGPWPAERHIDEDEKDNDDTIIISPASK